MLEQLNHAIGVEDVTTGQFRAGFFAKLLSIADRTKLTFIDSLEVACGFCTVLVKAWQTLTLTFNTFASMTALLMRLITEFKLGYFFCFLLFHYNCISCVYLNHLLIFSFLYIFFIVIQCENESWHLNLDILRLLAHQDR